jgi:hypothetical protein
VELIYHHRNRTVSSDFPKFAMGCVNSNRIKWQITVAMSDWILFQTTTFSPQIVEILYYKSQRHTRTQDTAKKKKDKIVSS